MAGKRFAAVLALALALAASPARSASVMVVNIDAPGEGLNDPTPVAPVGGNHGTTLGQQRLIAVQHAADVWGSLLESDTTVVIEVAFNPLPCTGVNAALGSGLALQAFANSPGVEIPDTWYHAALADKLAGSDLSPGTADLFAQFNGDLDDPICLGTRGFYYGLDNAHGLNFNMVHTALHEFAHGLGFSNFVTEATGGTLAGLGDVYSEYTEDVLTGKRWNEMNDAERAASAVNNNRVVWSGLHANEAATGELTGATVLLTITSPPVIGSFRVGHSPFGPTLLRSSIAGEIVRGLDPADAGGPSTFDACSPLTNAADVAGRIAIVDEGPCPFTQQVKNAQEAGAIGTIVVASAVTTPPPFPTGADPTITIPSARISLPNGTEVLGHLASGPVFGRLGADPSVPFGLERTSGKLLLNTPVPVQAGSSIGHWDFVAFKNLLMEPVINRDLLKDDVDITLEHFVDIGWFSDFDGVPDGVDGCIGSDRSATVVVDGCDAGVPNTVDANGCRISDGIEGCAEGAADHAAFVDCVAGLTNGLKEDGVITGDQKGAIQSCAGRADIP